MEYDWPPRSEASAGAESAALNSVCPVHFGSQPAPLLPLVELVYWEHVQSDEGYILS